MSTTKDLFSIQASEYSKFRPTYPPELFAYLAAQVGAEAAKSQAWDCATGNGQAAILLAPHFAKVIATDLSKKQLESATPHSKVVYREGLAVASGLPDESVALVTVAQAVHWFWKDEFFNEARRVLKPGGLVAVWCYGLAVIAPAVDEVIGDLYWNTLNGYWEQERRLVDQGYEQSVMPLPEVAPPKFKMTAEWSFPHLIGYLNTWSAVQTYIKKTGVNPVTELEARLKAAWAQDAGSATAILTVEWKLSVRIGRKT